MDRVEIEERLDRPEIGRISHPAFKPAWWLSSGHLQTLWPTVFRRRPWPRLRRERLELPDGDFLDLDWTLGGDGPRVVVLHGLEGSSGSPYARGMLQAVHDAGWRGVLMHFRGCSGVPNRLTRSYHSGETVDLDTVISILRRREPDGPIAVIGYSLGGNVLLKWLGERGADADVAAAVAISVPFLLNLCAERLERGVSRLYQWWLLRALRASVRTKFRPGEAPIDLDELDAWRTFRTFDDRVTAPLHGFAGVDDYYRRASARQYLSGIRIPTLIVHARDDPFMSEGVIPAAQELSTSTVFELSHQGGHVGFVSGTLPWKPDYWLERRVPSFLKGHF